MSKQLKLPTLLVIAENPTIRFWIKKHLDDQFFIIGASDIKEAINATNSRLDFIIIDSEMENALQICKEMQTRTIKSYAPIFLITGRLKKTYREKAIKSGVTDFLSDQLDLNEILLCIEKGKKAVGIREKTEDLGLSIKEHKVESNGSSFNPKLVLTDKVLKALANAKKDNASTSALFIQIDEKNNGDLQRLVVKFISTQVKVGDILIPSKEGIILLLFNTRFDVAKVMAERLKDKIHNHPFTTDEGVKSIIVSIVISQLKPSGDGVHKMVDAAVKSLKEHNGSNLIISIDKENQ